jgi:hypothetical protein
MKLVLILTNEFGKPNSIQREKKHHFTWGYAKLHEVIEIELVQQENYNNIEWRLWTKNKNAEHNSRLARLKFVVNSRSRFARNIILSGK